MTTPRKAGPPMLLLLAIMIAAPAALFLSLPWLKQQPQGTIFLLAGLTSAIAVATSFWFAVLHDRQLDEWQRSNARFSTQWGWAAGTGVVALLMALPPFRDFVVATVASIAQVPDPNYKLVTLAFAGGFAAVILAQTFCTALLSTGWALWKSRPARDAS